MITPIFNETKLHGIEKKLPEVKFPPSVKTLLNESFQKSLTRWIEGSIGFRGAMIRTDNQLNLAIFNEISSTYGSPLIVGSGVGGSQASLFEKLYVDEINNRHQLSSKQISVLVKKIAKLRQEFLKRGVPLFLLLSPSKAIHYEELIPPKFIDSTKTVSTNNYTELVAELKKASIPYFDGSEFITKLRSNSPYPVFPPGGTHWSEYASCLVVGELSKIFTPLINKGTLPEAPCSPYVEKPIPSPFDRDLSDLINVWNHSRFFAPLLYPTLPSAPMASEHFRPRAAFIGGSFLWTIFMYFEGYNIYQSRDMFYYYSTLFHFPGNTSNKISAKDFDWAKSLTSYDIVVLEINEANIHRAGAGFIGDALRDLKIRSTKSQK